jgi:hypothetical protein
VTHSFLPKSIIQSLSDNFLILRGKYKVTMYLINIPLYLAFSTAVINYHSATKVIYYFDFMLFKILDSKWTKNVIYQAFCSNDIIRYINIKIMLHHVIYLIWWNEWSPPQNICLAINGTIFEKSIFLQVMKLETLKWDHPGESRP